MAKRSVRRAREQQRAPNAAASPPTPSSATGPAVPTRHFWLGPLAAACVLVPVTIVVALLAAGGDDPVTGRAAATVTPSASEEAKKLEEASESRDTTQVTQLTALMRQYAEDLDPAVRGVNKTLPPERKRRVGPFASAREADEWVDATRKAAAFFDETVSGETETNVARGALATAVRGLARMAETYRLAVEHRAMRRELLETVRSQRDDAIDAWETAAIQVDVINIAAGFGHQHPPLPGGTGTSPDELPEGTGATGGG
jgi:hypothetical protein